MFSEQPVPQFEVNSRTVEVLYRLSQFGEARCRDTAVLIEDLQQRAAEYRADGSHLQDILFRTASLSSGTFSCGILSLAAQQYVSALVDTALLLGVKDSSCCSFFPAMNNLSNQVMHAEKKKKEVEGSVKAAGTRLGATLLLRNQLEHDLIAADGLQSLDSVKAEERFYNMEFVTTKKKELRKRQERWEAELRSRNLEACLSHQELLRLSEEVVDLRKETAPLKKKLEPYMDLSPNPSLAQVKVEEAKRELATLDCHLEKNLNFQ